MSRRASLGVDRAVEFHPWPLSGWETCPAVFFSSGRVHRVISYTRLELDILYEILSGKITFEAFGRAVAEGLQFPEKDEYGKSRVFYRLRDIAVELDPNADGMRRLVGGRRIAQVCRYTLNKHGLGPLAACSLNVSPGHEGYDFSPVAQVAFFSGAGTGGNRRFEFAVDRASALVYALGCLLGRAEYPKHDLTLIGASDAGFRSEEETAKMLVEAAKRAIKSGISTNNLSRTNLLGWATGSLNYDASQEFLEGFECGNAGLAVRSLAMEAGRELREEIS